MNEKNKILSKGIGIGIVIMTIATVASNVLNDRREKKTQK